MDEKKSNRFLKAAIGILIASALIFAGIIYMYVYHVSKYYDVEGDMYYAKNSQSSSQMFLMFKDGKMIAFFEPDESINLRMEYKYYLYAWKEFFFDTYLYEDSLFSIAKPEYDGRPVSFYLTCTKSEFVNREAMEYAYVEEKIGEKDIWTFYFTDSGCIIDGAFLDKVEEIPENVNTWLNIYSKIGDP